MNLHNGLFYFLSDEYVDDFPDEKLMQNKETINGVEHGRPCFFAFKDSDTNIMWMIPISSQVEKFREIERRKIARYGRCNTILFGDVLGREKAFLIQNMCPVTSKYVDELYLESVSGKPVRVDGRFEQKLIRAAREILDKERRGSRITFPNILTIENRLLNEEE